MTVFGLVKESRPFAEVSGKFVAVVDLIRSSSEDEVVGCVTLTITESPFSLLSELLARGGNLEASSDLVNIVLSSLLEAMLVTEICLYATGSGHLISLIRTSLALVIRLLLLPARYTLEEASVLLVAPWTVSVMLFPLQSGLGAILGLVGWFLPVPPGADLFNTRGLCQRR